MHLCPFLGTPDPGTNGPSGIANGKDFVVALGGTERTVKQQANTFMHELGHTLGLGHGGPRAALPKNQYEQNYKPNYLSIMNYAFQHDGLRYDELDGHLDYSRFQLPDLDENHLNETIGLNGGTQIDGYGTRFWCLGSNATPINDANDNIDWNCNYNDAETDIWTDINKSGGRSVLVSQNVLGAFSFHRRWNWTTWCFL